MASSLLKFGKLEFRFNWLIAICVLLFAGGLVRLGLWQLERASEKIETQRSFQQSGEQQATPITEVPIAGLEFDLIQHQNRRVALSGHYLNDKSIFLIYQNYQTQIGYEIVTPFQLDDSDMIVMVSRGWSGISDYAELAATLPRIEDQLLLEGQLYVPTAKQASQENIPHDLAWPLVIRYLNMEELAADFQSPLFPYVVRLAENQPGVLIRHWPVVLVDSGRNFSYALQWFAMAIAVIAVSLILSSNLLRLTQQNNKPR
ncbi:MAG: SURF1 family protein [Pseudomonadota bacterium]